MKSTEDRPVVRIFKIVGYLTALLTLFFGLSKVWDSVSAYRARRAQIDELVAASVIQRAGSDYRGAWDSLIQAAGVELTGEVRRNQEDLGMVWLRMLQATEKETFASRVDLVSPVLARGVPASDGIRKGDLLAHIGWGEFLRFRDDARERNLDTYYDDALTADPSNVFAHTFKAHWILWKRGAVPEAVKHFRAAIDSNREREFVRQFEFIALFNNGTAEAHAEALRVAAEMVRFSETMPKDIRRNIYSYIYWGSSRDAAAREALLKAVNPQDHLKMFQVLYGEDADSAFYGGDETLRDFWLASLLERADRRPEALEKFQQMKTKYDRQIQSGQKSPQSYYRAAEESIRRLSGGFQPH